MLCTLITLVSPWEFILKTPFNWVPTANKSGVSPPQFLNTQRGFFSTEDFWVIGAHHKAQNSWGGPQNSPFKGFKFPPFFCPQRFGPPRIFLRGGPPPIRIPPQPLIGKYLRAFLKQFSVVPELNGEVRIYTKKKGENSPKAPLNVLQPKVLLPHYSPKDKSSFRSFIKQDQNPS